MPEVRASPACPCGSGRTLASCCEPRLSGALPAATAVELMRSRYTAYALGDEAYLLRSWHPDTRPALLSLADDGTVWRGLRILRHEGGEAAHGEGVVEFVADYEHSGRRQSLHERSRFRRGAEGWLYLDGEIDPAPGPRVKQGRNAPCACGSGRKFKQCCGAGAA